jgi:hypothetical protein
VWLGCREDGAGFRGLGAWSAFSIADQTSRRHELETLDKAQEVIGDHIDRYRQRPHSGLNYRTPAEVAQIWDRCLGDLHTQAA